MKTVVITGGTGLLGMRISFLLKQRGYEVRHLSRTENLNALYPAYKWDLSTQSIDPKALEGVDAIIHLAGAGIADNRWTNNQKKIILDSRIKSSELLSKTLSKMSTKPPVFIACSAIGYYGNQADKILTEEAPIGKGFMSEVCERWEKSVESIRQQGIRTPIIRVGIVLSTKGGALKKLKMSYPFRVGSYFGNGEQYYSWIHLDDISNLFIHALEDNTMDSIYNGTSPNPATNKQLAQAIATAYQQRTALVPVPIFAAKMLMGEMSAIVLNSTRVLPQTLIERHYSFLFPDLIPALKDLLERKL